MSCRYDITERHLHNNNAREISIQLHAHQLRNNHCWGVPFALPRKWGKRPNNGKNGPKIGSKIRSRTMFHFSHSSAVFAHFPKFSGGISRRRPGRYAGRRPVSKTSVRPSESSGKNHININKFWGRCPGTGWVPKFCLCVFFGSFLMGEKNT